MNKQELDNLRKERKLLKLNKKSEKVQRSIEKVKLTEKWKSQKITENKDEHEKNINEYNPKNIETEICELWNKLNIFSPDYNYDATQSNYTICLPPPNVTGVLHIGHALTISIQDCLTRYHRMNGKNVLWLPGLDHAGIATQSVVEKKLLKKGINKYDLGRDNFIKEIWKWKNEHGGIINSQIKRMGASVDWSREVFTMDNNMCNAVNEAFIRMYNSGIIYRKKRFVNWSCKLNTCISDVECDDLVIDENSDRNILINSKLYPFGYLWSFAYKCIDTNDEIIVSTTRPETIFGDVAIAINKNDTRYTHLHNKYCKHPFLNKIIPIICDDIANIKFGTGCVKISPAHDQNDYECAQRHNLNIVEIFNDNGNMNENCDEFQNMFRYDARIKVLNKLNEMGLYRGKVEHIMTLKICSRSGDVIEPLLKPQWWANMDNLAKSAVEAVENGNLKISPPHYISTWNNYLNNIQPWCISRQLWWGHRIPAFLVWPINTPKPDSNIGDNWIIAKSYEEAKRRGEIKYNCKVNCEQDLDVLDTWFSSSLIPFASLGWPNIYSEEFIKYYPTTLLETGSDILFFWVARMVMMGLQLTNEIPFANIYFHSIVRDPNGIKMSKSLGNVIDPIHVIDGITLEELHETLINGNLSPNALDKAIETQKEYFPKGIPECGTDALRCSLLSCVNNNNKSINLSVDHILNYKQFCKKICNTIKLSSMIWGDNYKPIKISQTNIMDCWIISKLQCLLQNVNDAITEYDFSKYVYHIFTFWMNDLCDVYLEICKSMLLYFDGPICSEIINMQNNHKATLYVVIESSLKILHPIMPFITEKMWSMIPNNNMHPSISVSPYPKKEDIYYHPYLIVEFEFIQKVIKAIRTLVPHGMKKFIAKTTIIATITTNNEIWNEYLLKYRGEIIVLSNIYGVTVDNNNMETDGDKWNVILQY